MKRERPVMLFVTGTDTGVGKTVLTECLLLYLRSKGIKAVGLKPFCSGSREDAVRLQNASFPGASLDEINPYFCRRPVATGALRNPGYKVPKTGEITSRILRIAKSHKVTIVEGIGGVFAPITPDLFVLDLMKSLDCPALVVARHALGTLNHSFLTFSVLKRRGIPLEQVVMMKNILPDESAATNFSFLSHHIGFESVTKFPFLNFQGSKPRATKACENILKKTLARF